MGKVQISSKEHRTMNQREWDGVLGMESISDMALDHLIGLSGPWRRHCTHFKRNRPRRVGLVRYMTLIQQCLYYRKAAFIQMGQ